MPSGATCRRIDWDGSPPWARTGPPTSLRSDGATTRGRTLDVGGRNFERSKKYHDVERSGRAAIVIDDLASVDPWRPRGIEIRGGAEVLDDPPRIRIHPRRIVSWGLDGEDFFARDARTVG